MPPEMYRPPAASTGADSDATTSDAERALDAVLAEAASVLAVGSRSDPQERRAAQDAVFGAMVEYVAHRRAEGDTPERALVRLKRVFAPHATARPSVLTSEGLSAVAMRAFLAGYYGRRGRA